jgi:hypothetical protein
MFTEDALKFSWGEWSVTFRKRMMLVSTPLIETPGAVDRDTLKQSRFMLVNQLLGLYNLQ